MSPLTLTSTSDDSSQWTTMSERGANSVRPDDEMTGSEQEDGRMGGRLVSVPRCTRVDALEVPKGTSFADGDSDLDFRVNAQLLWSRDLQPPEEASLVLGLPVGTAVAVADRTAGRVGDSTLGANCP